MYGIKKVAELTGISPITLRAWENRYDVVKPSRTDGGTRLYTQENVDDLLWVISERETKKITVKEAMRLLQEKKENNRTSSIQPLTLDLAYAYETKLLLALRSFHTESADKLVDEMMKMYDYEDVFHHIFIPILYRVGELWETKELQVAQEHYISHYLQQVIEHYLFKIRTTADAPKALALCPPKELHVIGLYLFSLFLKRRGMDVIFIGENTPFANVKAIVEQQNIALVCLSTTMHDYTEDIIHLIQQLEQITVNKPDILVGGNGTVKLPTELQQYIIPNLLNEWEEWWKSKSFSTDIKGEFT
jgi:MerR family transcriptional regulator, light-induced transcriptional regulator